MTEPVRTCVVCRKRAEKTTLERFTWGAGASGPRADENQTAPGRGAYCCKNKKCKQKFSVDAKKWKKVFRK